MISTPAAVAVRTLASFVLAVTTVTARCAPAQTDSIPPSRAYWLSGAAAIAVGIAVDTRMRDVAAANHSTALDHLAADVDPLGLAGYLVPTLVGAYLLPTALRQHRWADATLRVGLGYAVSDGIEGILKPLVGRHRPLATGGAWRFHPGAAADAWHSFPSGHTVHVFSLAAAIADEAQNRWVTVASYGVASLVGAQRVYRQAHWTSDVLASAVLAIATSRTTVHWLADHGLWKILPPEHALAPR